MKKIAKRIVSILLICILSVTSVPIVTATTNSDWTLSGRCSYDSATDVYTLIPDRTYTSGVMQYNDSISSDFSLSLDYYTGNRAGGEDSRYGGDGFAVFYYCEELKKGDYWRPTSGYSVEIDTYCDDGFEKGQIHENHVAINSSTANHIAVAPIVEAEDDDWHNLNIIVRSGICTVYIDGTERISHETPTNNYDTLGIYCVTGAARNLHAVKNIEITTGADVSGEHFPDGYDFKEDSFYFGNYSDTALSKKYFTSLFDSANVEEIFRSNRNAGGLCCGFAYTTAAIYNNVPSANSIYKNRLPGNNIDENEKCENLRQILKRSFFHVDDKTISIDDYIKYNFVYQYSEDVMQQRMNTGFSSEIIQGYEFLYNENGIFNLYDLVKTVTSNNIGVIIWLDGLDVDGSVNPGCHTVLCVGVDENGIFIDDSNLREDHGFTDELGYLRINNDGTWVYEPYNGAYNSGNTGISYAMDYSKPYAILRTGNKVIADDHWINDETPGGSYIVGCEKLDAGKGLLYCNATNYQLNDIQTTEILDIGSGENSIEKTGKLYWVDENATIIITDIENEGMGAEFHRSSGDTIIDAVIPDGSSVTFGEEDTISIDAVVEEEYEIAYSYCSVDENYDSSVVQITLTGTANGDEVVASETEDGIQVTGLNDITVTYETPDGTAETKADVKDGSTVNITVNDDENTVETDWQDKEETETDEECKHSDANHDGICDACSEDFTKGCSCNCHGNAFMQFLHKIVSFLRKLFGMTQYQYCNCGKAHW